ncbi:MAG: SLC13 family permease, partial [Pseudomonadota bacterium]
MSAALQTPVRKGVVRAVSIGAGPILFGILTAVPPPQGLPGTSWWLIALLAWMVVWWLSEALPLAVTALLPVVVMPLSGIAPLREVTGSYGHPLIFLFLGGFMLARAIEAAGLHRRIALGIVSRIGAGPRNLTLGFVIATAFLSMWIT